MYQFNEQFHQVLREKKFDLRRKDHNNEWVYSGKISASDYHIIDFAVSVSKDDRHPIYQIVYHNLAVCKSFDDKGKWLDFLNKWNVTKGLYYYLCLGEDGRVFMRYIGEATCHPEQIYRILIQGSSLVYNVLSEIKYQFGESIIV